ncbi:HNH endonuclease family protein [Nocardia sp. NBC_01377]|uniref:HNH endonuclease family protein n=1 Tax=Nocardia sp. NBC_01377 TaxID=2903595 RepID=UPI00324BF5A6
MTRRYSERLTDDQRADLTHKLGNLLLLNHRKNAQANNYDYATKKGKYFKTSTGSAVFALTTQVLGYSEWTPEAIEARQEQLTGLLAKEWKLI